MKRYQKQTEKRFESLIKFLNTLKPEEKKASIGYLIMNLVQSGFDNQDEAIGFLTRLHHVLIKDTNEPANRCAPDRDFYVA